MEIFRSERLASALSALLVDILDIGMELPYVRVDVMARRRREMTARGRVKMLILISGGDRLFKSDSLVVLM